MEDNGDRKSGDDERFDAVVHRGVLEGPALTVFILKAKNEEEMLEVLNRRLEVCAEDKKDLNRRLMRLKIGKIWDRYRTFSVGNTS